MSIKARINKAEDAVKLDNTQPVYLWDDGTKSQEELLQDIPEADRGRVVIFSWRLSGEDEYPLSGDVKGAPDIDKEINQAVEEARAAGVSEEAIHKALQDETPYYLPPPPGPIEEPEEKPDDLVRLTGGGRRGRFNIDEG